jgi:hypothetical protein
LGWNYRIILHDEDPDTERHWYGLHECYYEPTGWDEQPTSFVCDKDEGPGAIIAALERALATLKKSAVVVESDRSTWVP